MNIYCTLARHWFILIKNIKKSNYTSFYTGVSQSVAAAPEFLPSFSYAAINGS